MTLMWPYGNDGFTQLDNQMWFFIFHLLIVANCKWWYIEFISIIISVKHYITNNNGRSTPAHWWWLDIKVDSKAHIQNKSCDRRLKKVTEILTRSCSVLHFSVIIVQLNHVTDFHFQTKSEKMFNLKFHFQLD